MKLNAINFSDGNEHIDSHYAARCGEVSAFGELDGDLDVETCVIGGGLAGLTCALELAKAGQNVALLESNRVAWGASGRNGGFVASGFARSMGSVVNATGMNDALELYQMSKAGRDYVYETIVENNLDHLIAGRGWLKLQRTKNYSVLTREREFLIENFGAQIKMIKAEELSEYVVSSRYFGALLEEDAFHILPLQYANELAKLAKNNGVKIYEKSKCLNLRPRSKLNRGKWIAVTVNGSISAENVVLATSAYGGPYPRLNRALIPVATYIISGKPDNAAIDKLIPFEGCISDTRRAGDYYRTLRPGRPGRPGRSGGERRLIWGGRITTRKSQPLKLSAMLKSDIAEVYPGFDNMEIEHAWSGLMGYAPSQMPIIGRLEEGLWAATAFGGHGLNTTAMAGQLIAKAITNGDDRNRLFGKFDPKWAGGIFGQLATQIAYWKLQLQDKWDER